MKRLMLIAILLLPLTCYADTFINSYMYSSSAHLRTYYLDDPTLDAAWYFENDLTDASVSGSGGAGSNDLTGSPTYNTTLNVQQGSYSMDFAPVASVGVLTQANMSSGMVGKNSGGTTNALTICGWVRIPSLGTYGQWIAWLGDTSDSSHAVYFGIGDANFNYRYLRLRLNKGTEPDDYDDFTGSTALSVDTNYFIAATWNGSVVNIYYMQSGGSSLTHEVVNTSRTTAISTSADTQWMAGYSYNGLGQCDEIAIFHAAKTEAELLQIAQHGLDGERE